MSQIQITHEISTRLANLRTVTTASFDFTRARQFNFEDNRGVSALIAYLNVIRTVGRLGSRYERTLEQDIKNCERIVTNARERDRQLAQTMWQ